ncbi:MULTISPECIES: HEPN domain-containing protein [Frankia]|nr:MULTISPECIES: HEPN domain-containing protein [Frankia]
MPTATSVEKIYLHVSTLRKEDVAAFSTGKSRHPFPIVEIVTQVVSDRLALAGEKLRTGDGMIRESYYRSAISRHYYAMYHAARAVVFAVEKGDDFERHSELPRHLPKQMAGVVTMEAELTEARLLRNQADYDCYPANLQAWEYDARKLAASAAVFVKTCESFVIENGYV